MARSVWKGPFVEESLIKKVEKQKTESQKRPIKTWSRKSTIIPEFVGVSFLVSWCMTKKCSCWCKFT